MHYWRLIKWNIHSCRKQTINLEERATFMQVYCFETTTPIAREVTSHMIYWFVLGLLYQYGFRQNFVASGSNVVTPDLSYLLKQTRRCPGYTMLVFDSPPALIWILEWEMCQGQYGHSHMTTNWREFKTQLYLRNWRGKIVAHTSLTQ